MRLALSCDHAGYELKRDLAAILGQKGHAVLDLGSFRMPSLLPLTVYTAIVPAAGVLIFLFTIEQLVNGWKHGFEGPEDRDDIPQFVIEEVAK